MVAQRLRSPLAVCHREKPLSFLPQEEGALGAGSLWGIYLGHVLCPALLLALWWFGKLFPAPHQCLVLPGPLFTDSLALDSF